MDKEDRAIIIHMSETLDTICAALSRPPNKLARVFEIAATVITLLGILSVIDIIKNWLGG
jgi:energy-converting hydrogenase Eha subunit F